MSFGAKKPTTENRPARSLPPPVQTKKSAAMAEARQDDGGNNRRSGKKNAVEAGLVKTSGAKEKSKNKTFTRANDVQSVVDQMTTADRSIDLPPPAPFALPKSEADGWSVPMMMKYVKESMELPDYVAEFKRAEIDGLRFIGMDETYHCGIDLKHDFHALKIGSHAAALREQVLERAAIERPESTTDWTPAHIAAWLYYDQACVHSAPLALRALLDAEKLKTFGSGKAAVEAMKALDNDDAETTIVALDGLLDRIASDALTFRPTDRFTLNEQPTASAAQSSTKKSKKQKSKTAIQRRREQEKANVEAEVEAMTENDRPLEQEGNGEDFSTSAKLNDLPIITEEDSKEILSPVAVVVKQEQDQSASNSTADEHNQTKKYVTGDAYSVSKEREQFLKKISELRGVVEQHAEAMHELRDQALQLKRENAAIHQQQKELIQEGSASQQLVASLVKDRDMAMRELENLSKLYAAHASQEQARVQTELESLAINTIQTQHENLHMAGHLLQHAQNPVSAGGDSDDLPLSSSSVLGTIRHASVEPLPKKENTSRVSFAGSGASVARGMAASKQSQEPFQQQQQYVDNDEDSDLEASVDKKQTEPLPIKEDINPPPMPPHQNESPVALAASQLLSTAGKKEEEKSVTQVDIIQMIGKTAEQEFNLWERIITKYRLLKGTVPNKNIADDKLLLHHIAVHWMRMGRRLLHDVTDLSLEKDWRKALRGLKKCVEKATSATNCREDAMEPHSKAAAVAVDDTLNKKKTSICKCFPYKTAAGMFFGLGLIQRLLNQYNDKDDKSQLVFLLNRIKYGELPITELSRENLRDFLDFHLGIDLTWDRFDSICQRFDSDRNGFISIISIISSFKNLTSFSDRLNILSAQFHCFFLLSLCTDTLVQSKLPITETFLFLISKNINSSASFKKYLKLENKRIEDEKLKKQKQQRFFQQINEQEDSRIAEEQLFCADVFYELSKEFISRTEQIPKPPLSQLSIRERRELQRKKARYFEEQEHFDFFMKHHQESCSALSRAVNIYDGERKDLITNLSTLFISQLKFRRQVIKQMLQNAIKDEEELQQIYCTTFQLNNKSKSDIPSNEQDMTSSLPSFDAWCDEQRYRRQIKKPSNSSTSQYLSVTKLKQHLSSVEENIAILLNQVTTPAKARRKMWSNSKPSSDDESISSSDEESEHEQKHQLLWKNDEIIDDQEMEFLMSELLGIAIPYCPSKCAHSSDTCHYALMMTQMHVEVALIHSYDYFTLAENMQLKTSEKKKAKLASSQTLKEIQQQLHQELWGENETMKPSSADAVTRPFKVTTEVDRIMEEQRVEIAERYMEFLNHRAARKKKILRSLFNLWESAKYAVIEGNKVTVFGNEEEIERRRAAMMPVDDILSQTREIQRIVAAEMQKPFDTKTEQLAERVNQLRERLAQHTLHDKDGALASALQEISSLENSLLQANHDAMRLASRIVKQLSVTSAAAAAGAHTSPKRDGHQKKTVQFGRIKEPMIPMGYKETIH